MSVQIHGIEFNTVFEARVPITSFAGTVSAATRTATFTETADYTLCKVGSILIADGDTRIIVALLGSDQVTVDVDSTWAGATAITSLQDPISQHKDDSGNVDMYVNALGGIGLIGGVGSLQKGLVFFDGDSGLYESTDDAFAIQIAGSNRWEISSTKIGAIVAGGLLKTGGSATEPYLASSADTNTGMGRAGADQLSLIAGGIEALRLIEDTTIEIRIAKNDSWLSGLNYAGSAAVNMFKVNVDDEIEIGGTLILGASIEAAEDSGAVTLTDMPVSATPADGAEMSFTHKIDGTNILKVYAEADHAGGIKNPSVRPNAPLIYDQAPQVLTGAGAVDITSAITHIVTDGVNALTLADGVEGQTKFIIMKTDVNDGTLTPDSLGNGSTITFDDVGDSAHLLFTNAAWHWMGGTATLA